jgi:glycosyltransferase involved in cell wall biosynthesis/SAM-dependent methyltransferase
VTRNARGKGGASSFAGTSQEALELERKQRVATLGQPPNLQGNPPLVTVVIPCYNQAHFLGEAIESVLSQTYRNFEVIVVDDGSTDNTSEVASRYEGVRLIWQENRGLAGARNRGLEEAKGEYVVFLDADDRLLPGALEAGLGCFEAHPECAFVFGNSRYIAEDGTLLSNRGKSGWAPAPHGEGDHYFALLRGNYISITARVMYRRAVFDDVGGFDGNVSACADYDHYLRVARRYPVQRHGEQVAEYRQHRASMSRDYALMLTSALTVLHRQRKFVRANEHYRKAYEIGDRYWREYYGDPLVGEVRIYMREGKWERALRGLSVLGRYYRQGIILLLGGKRMEWHKLSQELRTCSEQLQTRTQQVRELRRELTQQRQRANRLAKRSKGVLDQKGKADPQKQDAGSGRRGRPPVGKVDFGSLRRLNPISTMFGYDRGRPIDRYYIEEGFLARYADDIRGQVLEFGDASYTQEFGGERVTVSDVLHVDEGSPQATIVADLSRADYIPSDTFDCIIFTQTLHLIYDVRSAIQTLHRILKPEGVLLATFPGISQVARDRWGDQCYWAFTHLSARRLFEERFPVSNVEVEAHGNVLTAISFLHGLAAEELREQELKRRKPGYEVVITVRAVKPGR